jgi:flagellar basal body rod protein FlgB
MLSLRLPHEQDQAITAIAQRLGLSRSVWLRQIIAQGIANQATPDPHARYLELMAGVGTDEHSTDGIAHRARNHSHMLKAKLQRQHQAQQQTPQQAKAA